MTIINCLLSPTYENPRGFSIRFSFAKLVAKIRSEIIYKHIVHNLKKNMIKYGICGLRDKVRISASTAKSEIHYYKFLYQP